MLLFALLLLSQGYTQRGVVESHAEVYPQTALNDSSHAVAEFLVRHESFYRPSPNLQFAGAVEVRTDTHRQTERRFRVDFRDRSIERPLVAVRRLSAQFHRGGLTVEAGKQLIRWGKTDIVNPTDRFAPRDFLTVVDDEFLGVVAARATWEHGANTLDMVWSPMLTPSRVPLTNQRWVVPPPGVPFGGIVPVTRNIPDGPQSGLRWSRVGLVEFSTAFYSGFDHLPSFEVVPGAEAIHQFYPKMRMAGGDVAVPLPWLTLKGEAGYFSSPDDRMDEYVLYVVQLERQSGEWFFVGGYGGEVVTDNRLLAGDFNPDRGRTRTILGRAGYTIDTNRSVAMEGAVRQNGDGVWIKGEYSQAFGQHWRLTAGFSLIRGQPNDFIGQYHRNSHGSIAVRYSF